MIYKKWNMEPQKRSQGKMQLIQIFDCKTIQYTTVVVWLDGRNYWQIGGRVEPVLLLWGIKEEECSQWTVPKITHSVTAGERNIILKSSNFFCKFIRKVWSNVDLFKVLRVIGNSGSVGNHHRNLCKFNFYKSLEKVVTFW